MKKILSISIVIISFYSCKKENPNTTNPQTNPITMGASYQGGNIFYIDGTGNHGLICAPVNQGTASWGCSNTSVNGTTKVIGSGFQNTVNIVSYCSTINKAADTCLNLVLNGYNDWYLPSIDELQLIYINLKSNGIGSFPSGSYWSSTQFGNPPGWSQYASYYMTFNNTQQSYLTSRMDICNVRAIRSF